MIGCWTFNFTKGLCGRSSFFWPALLRQLISMALAGLSTEDLLTKIAEADIEVTEVEAQRFRGKFI